MKTKILKVVIIIAVLGLSALAGTLIGHADSSQDYSCYGTVTGRHYFYNQYTLRADGDHYDAFLYSGFIHGTRYVNWCKSRLAYYYGKPMLFYPMFNGLWVTKSEINLKR